MTNYQYSNTISCPKSADFEPFVRDLAWVLELELELEKNETGFIFKTQHFRFRTKSTSQEKIESFRRQLESAVADYAARAAGQYGSRR